MMDETGAFGKAALSWLEAGWQPIPTRVPTAESNTKQPLVEGVTGKKGEIVGRKQVEGWLKKSWFRKANIGLRLPDGVIGIDVDEYGTKHGAKELRKLQKEHGLGPVPKTIVVTARDDDKFSGIYLFRVPKGRIWKDKPCPGVEIIQPRHRFVSAPPSIHHTGSEYKWYHQRNQDVRFLDETFTVEDIPWLPDKWVEWLTKGSAGDQPDSADLTREEVATWLDGRPGPEMCRRMKDRVGAATRELGAYGESDAHDPARNKVWEITNLSVEGHSGVRAALRAIEAAFKGALYIRGDDIRLNDAEEEWANLVNGAVEGKFNEPTRDRCSCGTEGPGESVTVDIFSEEEQLEFDVAARVRRLKVEEMARQQLVAESWVPAPDLGTVAEQLANGIPEVPDFVDNLAKVKQNVLAIGQFKAGKTTLAMNFADAAVTGKPFLGRFAVHLPEDTSVTFSNHELSREQALSWFAKMGLYESVDAKRLWLDTWVGHRFTLPSPHVEDFLVERLVKRKSSVWIIDPFGTAYSGEENSNSEVGAWTDAIDRISVRANLSLVLITAHAGETNAGEDAPRKARGATRLMDWPGVFWTYSHDGQGQEIPPNDFRYLQAFGRDIEEPMMTLEFNRMTLRLTAKGGGISREQNRLEQLAIKIYDILAFNTRPMDMTTLYAEFDTTATSRKAGEIKAAIKYGKRRSWFGEEGAGRQKLMSIGPESPHDQRNTTGG